MLHSSTSSEILLIKNVFIRLSAGKMANSAGKSDSARICHEVLKNLAESFQFLAGEIPPTHHRRGRRSTETKFTALFRLVTSNRSSIVFHILILQGLR
jgi:hypothetical protein